MTVTTATCVKCGNALEIKQVCEHCGNRGAIGAWADAASDAVYWKRRAEEAERWLGIIVEQYDAIQEDCAALTAENERLGVEARLAADTIKLRDRQLGELQQRILDTRAEMIQKVRTSIVTRMTFEQGQVAALEAVDAALEAEEIKP